jgi:hypothetical protein
MSNLSNPSLTLNVKVYVLVLIFIFIQNIYQITLDEISSNMLGSCTKLRTLVDLVQVDIEGLI